jgi:DNA-binding IscR family transcriptional regulator
MSVKSVQFRVAAHIMAALGCYHGEEISSATLAESVNADREHTESTLQLCYGMA